VLDCITGEPAMSRFVAVMPKGNSRIRAAAVIWFLSGTRIGAFVTLPLSAVEIETRIVKQWPK
jgi:hypothetical protein